MSLSEPQIFYCIGYQITMKKPTHTRVVVQEDCLKALNLSIAEGAQVFRCWSASVIKSGKWKSAGLYRDAITSKNKQPELRFSEPTIVA